MLRLNGGGGTKRSNTSDSASVPRQLPSPKTRVFSSDGDKFSRPTCAANFGEPPEDDITNIRSDPIEQFDLPCGGFPGQPFRLAGGESPVRSGLVPRSLPNMPPLRGWRFVWFCFSKDAAPTALPPHEPRSAARRATHASLTNTGRKIHDPLDHPHRRCSAWLGRMVSP